MGGDEFGIVLGGIRGEEEAATSAKRLLGALEESVLVEGQWISVGASVGIALFPQHGAEPAALMRRADVALYAAKRAGRNQFAWFDQQLDRELTERLSLEEDMRTGILKGEFVPFFQPLIDLESRELVGFETLARWRSRTTVSSRSPSFFSRSARISSNVATRRFSSSSNARSFCSVTDVGSPPRRGAHGAGGVAGGAA